MVQILEGGKIPQSVMILMLAFVQNLRFGSATADAGPAMWQCVRRVTCWRHNGRLRISVTICPMSCHIPEDLHLCTFLDCLLLEEERLLF